jgi:hypothetical protein
MRIHAHLCTYMHVCMYTSHLHMHTCVHICMYVCIHHTYTHTHMTVHGAARADTAMIVLEGAYNTTDACTYTCTTCQCTNASTLPRSNGSAYSSELYTHTHAGLARYFWVTLP